MSLKYDWPGMPPRAGETSTPQLGQLRIDPLKKVFSGKFFQQGFENQHSLKVETKNPINSQNTKSRRADLNNIRMVATEAFEQQSKIEINALRGKMVQKPKSHHHYDRAMEKFATYPTSYIANENIVSIADPFDDQAVKISSAIFSHQKKPQKNYEGSEI
jgi:hypothetical protein